MFDPNMLVARDDLSGILGVSVTTVRHLQNRGVFRPVEGRSKYVLAEAMRSYVQHKLDDRRLVAPEPGAKAELVVEQHRKLKIENDVSEGLLLSRAAVEAVADVLSRAFRLHLDTLPGRMAAEIAGIADPAIVKERLLEECRRILNDTARHLRDVAAPPDLASDQPLPDEAGDSADSHAAGNGAAGA